ncbi:MAG: glutamate--cysteine ligase [Candidatus Nanopelagicales bacterium]
MVDFLPSPGTSLGIEVELAIVDAEKGGLACLAPEVLAEVSAPYDSGEHPKIKKELFQCTIEVITGVCQTVAEARADLAETMLEVQDAVASRGAGVIGAGLHPFTPWHELSRSEGERYERLVTTIAWPARRLTTHGVHVHVGVRSGDKAIATVNSLSGYLPIFLALSASSPFWHGQDTGLASTRTKIFEAMPTTGLPPHLKDWDEFNVFLDTLITAGTIESVREVWWDIRPHPGYGTVELRMCDAMPTLWETCAMAALAQCLVKTFDEMMDRGETPPVPREWVRRENKWRAARWGVDAELVVDESGSTRPLRDVLADLVADLMPTAERLGCSAELADLLVIAARGPSYVRQRRLVEEGAGLDEVVAALRAELLQDIADTPESRG